MSYLDMCVDKNITVRDAMQTIDKLGNKIVFITDGKVLSAVLTDGDIRRYLLKEGTLNDKAINAANKNPKIAHSFEAAKRLYNKRNYIAIPIINENNEIIDIYVGEDGAEEKRYSLNIPVVINAGGKGTRLYPYTKILPKPLIPVGDLPILEHIMQSYIKYGCTDFHIIVNYKKDLIKAFFSDNENQYNITWHDEDKPLGTGGGLGLLKGKLQNAFFFANCDTLNQCNFDSVLRFHREKKNLITMVCAYRNLTIPYGIVEMGKNGAIKSMREKPEMSFLTNTGMYIVEPQVLDNIEEGAAIDFPDIIEKEMEKGRNVAVYPISENEWMDMGQFATLEEMRKYIEGDE